eukprot:42104-Amphidinium_carterae.1
MAWEPNGWYYFCMLLCKDVDADHISGSSGHFRRSGCWQIPPRVLNSSARDSSVEGQRTRLKIDGRKHQWQHRSLHSELRIGSDGITANFLDALEEDSEGSSGYIAGYTTLEVKTNPQ